jgi:hypothetical protein
MTAPAPEIEHPEPHSDHLSHTAPAESHVIEKSLWRRIMDWRGTFFILSLLAHIVVIGVAAFLVVQVVQARKEKLKFTAPPPAPPAEHSVKPSKKTAAAAPAVTKRITSKAVNTSIALPAMEMNSSSPDIMSSVMSGMGAAGLGAGAAGGAGLASMSLSGLTAFGFKGNGSGLKGYFYDLKQTPGRVPTGIKPGDDVGHLKVITDFVDAGWDDAVLDKFYKARDPMNTLQIYIPVMPATEAPKAFGVENEVKPGAWVIHYKGTVIAPRDGKFFFVGFADDLMMVRFDGVNVLAVGTMGHTPDSVLRDKYKTDNEFIKPIEGVGAVRYGKTFEVKGGKAYPIDILISEMPGGSFRATLAIGEDKPETPYRKSKLAGRQHPPLAYPLFQVKKGMPLPEWKDGAFEVDPKPTVFQAR